MKANEIMQEMDSNVSKMKQIIDNKRLNKGALTNRTANGGITPFSFDTSNISMEMSQNVQDNGLSYMSGMGSLTPRQES